MQEYVGAIHIHSKYSDGSGRIEEIMAAANESMLDFVILTDHNTLRAKDEGQEKWHNKTFLLVGCEINDKHNLNHYLALGINKALSTRQEAVSYVKKVKDDGGIGFIAHPHEKRNLMPEHPPYPWTAWDSQDFTGIEIWNHMSEWMEGLTEENKYNHFVHPLKSISSPPEETLNVWDDLNISRKVTAIGGIDAHAHKVNLMGFIEIEVFPYKVLFKSIRTHILTDKKFNFSDGIEASAETKNIILECLKEGRSFVANDYIAESKGFRFFCKSGNKRYNCGDTVKLGSNCLLKVILPKTDGRIVLVRNGKRIDETENIEADFIIKSEGIYRVEVFKNKKAWIFSNHIRIVN